MGDEWKVHVRDDGIGVDPARAGTVFGLFARLHTATVTLPVPA